MLNKRNLIGTLLQGIVEYLLFFPLLLIIGIYIVDHLQLWSWLVSILGLFIIGVLFRTLLPNQKWWMHAGFSIIVGILPSFIFGGHLLFVILLAVIHPVFVYRGMMYAGRSGGSLLPVSFLWLGGLGIYFIGYFVFRYVETLNPYLTLFTVFGAILVVLTLFISNNDHLKSATLSKERVPFISRAIKNQNQIFLLITISVIALITNGQMIREGLWNGFRTSIQWIITLLSGSEDQQIIEEPPPPSSAAPKLPFVETKEPSAFAELLEVIMMYVVYFLLFVAMIVLLLLLVKRTRLWIKKIVGTFILFLKQMVSRSTKRVETAQYVDEKESVFSWKEWKEEQQEKAKGLMQNIFKRKPSWDSLSNQEKVRFVYRELLLQEMGNINYKSTYTPSEMLEQLIVSVSMDEKKIGRLRTAYEQTRYGEQDIEENIIEEIYSLIKK